MTPKVSFRLNRTKITENKSEESPKHNLKENKYKEKPTAHTIYLWSTYIYNVRIYLCRDFNFTAL